MAANRFKFYIEPGQWTATSLSKFGNSAIAFTNSNAILLLQTRLVRDVVDWQAIQDTYIQILPKPTEPTTLSYSQGARVAANSINTLSRAVSLVPVAGSLLSGFLGVIGSIIGQVADATSGSSDKYELIQAIREVVRTENDRQSAEVAASTFINGYNYLESLDPLALGPMRPKT